MEKNEFNIDFDDDSYSDINDSDEFYADPEKKEEFYLEFKGLREKFSDTFLTNEEYEKLYNTAITTNQIPLAYIIRTLTETGIRYSYINYLTVEALQQSELTYEIKRNIQA